MEPGTIVGDRFVIESEAGSGGMGTVYLGRDQRNEQAVALKLLRVPRSGGAERFLREAEILAGLRHPGIVRYVAHGHAPDGRLYLAMEWLDGKDLGHVLRRRALTVRESVQIALRAADALAAAHRSGVVHRDVKPSNLFLVDGDVEQVKVIDFGVARLAGRPRVTTRTGVVIGTPGYFAPEQARGERDVTAAADVFSLGCVLFRMLTRRPPFVGHFVAVLAKILADPAPRARELREGVPEPLDDLLARMLAKDPAQRPQDGAAAAEELRALLPVLDDARSAASKLPPPLSITGREQRLVSVLLAAPPAPEPTLRDSRSGSEDEPGPTSASLRAIAATFGGKLDRLVSGSILVTLAQGGGAIDQAAAAARCALAMRAAMPGAVMVLATGLGVVAERLPVGEVIDRAAGLLEAARRRPDGTIRIDDVTAGLLGARFDVADEPGARSLRGEHDGDTPARTLLGRPSPCVGRTREIGMLVGLFDECEAESVACVAMITAPAGAGKSRLRQEVCARIGARAEVWIGAGDPLSTGSPFGLLGRAVRRAIGIRDEDPPAERHEALRARVARCVPEDERPLVTEFLGELLDAPRVGAASVALAAARLDPVMMGDRMRWAFERFLRAETAERPVVLVLEDLHWGDLATVKLVHAAVRELDDRPLLVLALARPEIDDRLPGIWRERLSLRIDLPPLPQRASERLCREHLGEGADPATIARIVERADGNALYLEELIRAASEGKGTDLPETVLAVIEARLEGLAAAARRLLRAASVFGPTFREGGVAALLGAEERGGAAARDGLRDLVEREILTPAADGGAAGDPAYAFRHALVREAAYATLTEADRVLGHRLAGAWLERAGERDAGLLGEHFERGGQRALAASRYRQAAEHALTGSDLEAALAWSDRAARCGLAGEELGAVRRIEAEVHASRGANAAAARAGVEAMGLLARGSAAFFHAAADVATAESRLGNDETIASLGEQLAATKPLPGAVGPCVIALARTAMLLLHVGREALVERLAARIEAFRASGGELGPVGVAWLTRLAAVRALHAGDPAAYLELTAAAAGSFEAAGDVRSACVQRGNVGFAYLQLGAYAEAERVLAGALETAKKQGIDHGVTLIKHNLGLAKALGARGPDSARGPRSAPGPDSGRGPRSGRADPLVEAARIEQEAVSEFEAQANRRMEGFARFYLAMIRALAGDAERAASDAAEACEVLEVAPPGRAAVLAWRARFELGQGRVEEARALAAEAMGVLDSLGGIEEGESLIRLAHAEALWASGDLAQARAAVMHARDRLLERAARISRPELRKSFLERVPENARTLELTGLLAEA
jgi:serine/threonine protein kinase